MLKKEITHTKILSVIFLITLFYLLFPTNNSTLDAYGYATSVKYNNDLFKPHHLLYNAFQYILYKFALLLNFQIDALSLSKVINAVFQFFNLTLMYLIFKKLRVKNQEILYLILILGFGYSSVRFATENENYIIPITFSLMGSCFFLSFIHSKKTYFLFLSSLFGAIACLFHQIHIFWWFGILIGITIYFKKIKWILIYVIPVIIVPLTYLLVIKFYNHQTLNLHHILHFILHDYYSGTAKSEFGSNNFILTVVNSIRTFFQVHPIIILLIKRNILYIIPLFFLGYLVFITFKLLYKRSLFSKSDSKNSIFYNTHLIIFILNFLFAFYAVGNIEFMVMLPFLLFLSIFQKFKPASYFLKTLAFTLIVWNFTYVLYPNNKYSFYQDQDLVNFIKEHPNDLYLVHQHTVINQLEYKTGKRNPKNIIRLDRLNKVSDLQTDHKKYFYTDVIHKPQILNRSAFLNTKKIDFSKYKKEKIKTYQGLYGTSTIYKVYFRDSVN